MLSSDQPAENTEDPTTQSPIAILPCLPSNGFSVSQTSHWEDPIWDFEDPSKSSRASESRIAWDFILPDGTRFTDPEWANLLDAFKRLAWSLFTDPRGIRRTAKKPGGAAKLNEGIRYLARWMNRRNYISFAELNDAASTLYLEDLAESSAMPSVEGMEEKEATKSFSAKGARVELGLSVGQVYTRVVIWLQLWHQTSALRKVDVPTLPIAPFKGKEANTVAREVAVRAYNLIPSLPDEVALPLMSAAQRMIGVPADDVIRLHTLYFDTLRDIEKRGVSRAYGHKILLKALSTFRFSIITGESKPCRGSIAEIEVDEFGVMFRHDIHPSHLSGTPLLRWLIIAICTACAIVIQSGTGIRTSELCGPEPGMNPDTGLPCSVQVRRSGSGILELFYLQGWVFKGEVTPREDEWILGCRPVGSAVIPPPVRALEVLSRLLDPWRRLAGDSSAAKSLFVLPARGYGMPDPCKDSKINAATSTVIREWQKRFVFRYVDLSHLPDRSRRGEDLVPYRETKGVCFVPSQFRKTFARYVCGTDSRMLPAVSRHFKHMSLAMTEGYLGRNPMLQDAFESNLNESTSRYLYEYARGKQAPAGRMAKLIEQNLAELQALIADRDESDGRREIRKWVCQNNLRIFFSPHGKCCLPFDPLGARCHQEAGTVHWLNIEPNYSTRRPSLCLGCSCFLIDEEHKDFWVQRYIENRKAFNAGVALGKAADYRVAEERAAQSAAVLLALNVPLPEV